MLIKSIDVLRQFVRGLRTVSAVAAFALTSTAAYADQFTLTFNHAPIDVPYGGQITSLSWTLPDPTVSFNPVGPESGDQPNLLAQASAQVDIALILIGTRALS
ncbi:MAG TPA: hypothetical protein VIX42_08600 [Edaphobacter sp.]